MAGGRGAAGVGTEGLRESGGQQLKPESRQVPRAVRREEVRTVHKHLQVGFLDDCVLLLCWLCTFI